MESTSPLVFFVILNWNGADDTLACLKSLAQTSYDRFEAVVVENGSSDNSLARISSYQSPYPLHILAKKENFGFAGGVNLGMRYGMTHGADFIFLLNNDAEISSDTLEKMVAASQRNPSTGIFGPVVYYISGNVRTDKIWFAGGRINWFDIARAGKHLTTLPSMQGVFPTTFVTGGAMLIRRKTIEAVGECDERFFLYFEDVDYNLRAKKAGWGIVVVSDAKVWHKVSATALSKVGSPGILYYHHRNGMLLAQKHAPLFIEIYMHIWAMLKIKKQWLKILLGRDVPVARAIFTGIRDYYRHNFGKLKGTV